MKKVINVVCKSTLQDQMNSIYAFWGNQLELSNNLESIPKTLIRESAVAAEKETLESGECRYFYCPAYHICPFNDEIMIGVKGRASKKKFDVKFEFSGNPQQKTDYKESVGFSDGVTDDVIKG